MLLSIAPRPCMYFHCRGRRGTSVGSSGAGQNSPAGTTVVDLYIGSILLMRHIKG